MSAARPWTQNGPSCLVRDRANYPSICMFLPHEKPQAEQGGPGPLMNEMQIWRKENVLHLVYWCFLVRAE